MKVTTKAQQELDTIGKEKPKESFDDKLPKPIKRGSNLKGRLPGVKNKSTLFKEAMQKKFEVKMNKNFQRILEVLADKAEEGDMAAIKMIMDRVIPQSKSVDMGDMAAKKGLSINISVGSVEKDPVDITDDSVVN